MRLASVLVIAATVSPAHALADNALEARVEAEAGKTWLDVDPVFAPTLEGLTATDRQLIRERYAVTRTTQLVLELDQWANQDAALPALDVRAQGWHATARLVRDFGFATLSLQATLSDIDTPFGRGRYDDLGISVMRTIQRAHGKRVWFGISLGRRRWHVDSDQPEPPAGEKNGTQAMLVVGWTF